MDCMSCHSGEQKPHDEVTRFMYKQARQDGMETIYERFARQQPRRYHFLLAKPELVCRAFNVHGDKIVMRRPTREEVITELGIGGVFPALPAGR